MSWYVYLARCADHTLYCGITNDIKARFATHNAGRGARYTRSRLPVVCVWKKRVRDRSAALKLEYAIKRLSRAEKHAIAARATVGGRGTRFRKGPHPLPPLL